MDTTHAMPNKKDFENHKNNILYNKGRKSNKIFGYKTDSFNKV